MPLQKAKNLLPISKMLNVPLKNYPFNFDDQYGLSAVTIMVALVDPVYKPF